jgi:hypothetical protein
MCARLRLVRALFWTIFKCHVEEFLFFLRWSRGSVCIVMQTGKALFRKTTPLWIYVGCVCVLSVAVEPVITFLPSLLPCGFDTAPGVCAKSAKLGLCA